MGRDLRDDEIVCIYKAEPQLWIGGVSNKFTWKCMTWICMK